MNLSRAGIFLEEYQKLNESPQNGYLVDDESQSKLSIRNQVIKLEKEGKEVIKSSTFFKNVKFIKTLHKAISQNPELYSKFCIQDLHQRGDVFYVYSCKELKLPPELSFLYLVQGDEISGFVKFEDRSPIRIDGKVLSVSKSLMWKNFYFNEYYLSYLIYEFWFGKLNKSYFLSDDLYTQKGYSSLFNLCKDCIKDYKISIIDTQKESRIQIFKTIKDLEFDLPKYFGDSKEYQKYRILIEKQ